jgi:biopolymer transport protein ExbB/TolQ
LKYNKLFFGYGSRAAGCVVGLIAQSRFRRCWASQEAHMGTESFLIVMLGIVAFLLVVAVVLMALVATHLKAMKREAEAVRAQLAKMDWTQLLFNGVQQLKDIVKSLETIDKRLQKLEAIEKVQLSHINFRAGV